MRVKFYKLINWYLIIYGLMIYMLYMKVGYRGYDLDSFNFLYNHREYGSDMVENFAFVVNNNPYFKNEAWHNPFYPPAAYLFIIAMREFGFTTFGSWLLLNLILMSIFIYVLKKYQKFKISDSFFWGFIFFLSYPFLFGLDRGNLETICILLVSTALVIPNKMVKSILIGIAASLKLTPFIFILLFFRRRDWQYFVLTLIVFSFLTCVAVIYMDGGALAQLKEFIKYTTLHSQVLLTNPVEYSGYEGPKEYILQGSTTDLFDAIRIVFLKSEIYYPGTLPISIYRIAMVSVGLLFLYVYSELSEFEIVLMISILYTIVVPLTYVPRLAIFIPVLIMAIDSKKMFVLPAIILFLLLPKSLFQIAVKVDVNQILVPVVLFCIYLKIIFEKLFFTSKLSFKIPSVT